MQEQSEHSLIQSPQVRCIYMQEHSVHLLNAHKTSIPVPVGAMYLHMQERSVHSLIRPPIFTVITEVWPPANRAVVRNNLTVIIEVVLIEGFLYNNKKCIYQL